MQRLDRSSGSSSKEAKHIFISYNHGSKATVLRLRDQLKAAGFMVWVDEEGVCTYVFVEDSKPSSRVSSYSNFILDEIG